MRASAKELIVSIEMDTHKDCRHSCAGGCYQPSVPFPSLLSSMPVSHFSTCKSAKVMSLLALVILKMYVYW